MEFEEDAARSDVAPVHAEVPSVELQHEMPEVGDAPTDDGALALPEQYAALGDMDADDIGARLRAGHMLSQEELDLLKQRAEASAASDADEIGARLHAGHMLSQEELDLLKQRAEASALQDVDEIGARLHAGHILSRAELDLLKQRGEAVVAPDAAAGGAGEPPPAGALILSDDDIALLQGAVHNAETAALGRLHVLSAGHLLAEQPEQNGSIADEVARQRAQLAHARQLREEEESARRDDRLDAIGAAFHRRVGQGYELVRETFAAFDTDGRGSITAREFYHGLLGMNIDCNGDEAKRLFDHLDVDGSGTLDYRELHGLVMQQQQQQQQSGGLMGLTSSRGVANLRKSGGGDAAGGARRGAKATKLRGSAGTLREQLLALLDDSKARVVDVLAQWDRDGSGFIDKEEFYEALGALGVACTADDAAAVFDAWDTDGSGELDYKELRKKLRAGSLVELDQSLQPGAAGEIATRSENPHALRTDGPQTSRSRVVGAGGVSLDGPLSLGEQLWRLLQANGARVRDLFLEWDKDGSGQVDADEFARALALLGLPNDRDAADALFQTLDADGSGQIDYRELYKTLRQHQRKGGGSGGGGLGRGGTRRALAAPRARRQADGARAGAAAGIAAQAEPTDHRYDG